MALETKDFEAFLTPQESAPIFERAAKSSVAQSLGVQTEVGINGNAIPVVTGKVKAGWTKEGEHKNISDSALGVKNIKPEKMSVIVPVSAEVARANPAGIVELVYKQVGDAFAEAFDQAAFVGGADSPFSTSIGQTTKSVELGTAAKADGGIYADLNAGLSLLVEDKKRLNGFALDARVEPRLNSAVDANGNPIFVDVVQDFSAVRAGRLMGRPAYIGEEVGTDTVLGYGGDWSQLAWGVTSGVSYRISTEGTIVQNGEVISAFGQNLVFILAEAEYGLLVNDPQAFVKYTAGA